MATTSTTAALDLLRPDPPVEKTELPEKPEEDEEDELVKRMATFLMKKTTGF
jgi:hypothetical protein